MSEKSDSDRPSSRLSSSPEQLAAEQVLDDKDNLDEIPKETSVRMESRLTVENLKLHEEQNISTPTLSRNSNSSLGPVKIPGRSELRPESAGDLDTSVASQKSSISSRGPGKATLKSSEPLPPIGINRSQVSNEGSFSDSASNASRSKPQSRSKPRIMSFRREINTDYEGSGFNNTATHSTALGPPEKATELESSNIDTKDIKPPSKIEKKIQSKSKAVREVVKRKGANGKEYVVINMPTETEWSWLESVKQAGIDPTALDSTVTFERTAKPTEADKDKKQRKHLLSVGADSDDSGSFPGSFALESDDENEEESQGVPELELSSDSEISGDEGMMTGGRKKKTIPGVGPPTILQYQREKPGIDCEGPEYRKKEIFSGDEEVDPSLLLELGGCEFCGNSVQPFPSAEELESHPKEELFCCAEYERFTHFVKENAPESKYPIDEKISVAVHPHFGDKQARRDAKERAALKMKEREVARQRAQGAVANQPGSFQFAIGRQMKTISYSLASVKCLDEGWTIRAPSPLPQPDEEEEIFEAEPHASLFSRVAMRDEGELSVVEKFYDNGSIFMLTFPDGTGNIFYPSGFLAMTISLTEGHYTYIIQDNNSCYNGDILAVFESTGRTVSYHSNGKVRLFMDAVGGIFCDQSGSRRKKWMWKDPVNHVHAPPFQPICFALNRQFGLRVVAQDQVYLTFLCEKRSIKFNVGVKLKLIFPDTLPPFHIENNELHLAESKTQIRALFNKLQTILKFSKSSMVEKMKPPTHVTNQMSRNAKLKERIDEQKPKSKDTPVVIVK